MEGNFFFAYRRKYVNKVINKNVHVKKRVPENLYASNDV